MLTTSGLVKLACALLTILGQSARADTWYLLDFDGTAVDDQSPRSTWHRMWHLKCVESLRNSAQINPQALGLPDVVPVTYREVRRLMPMLARGPAELNWPHPVALDADPLHPERQLEIIPGCYAVSRDRTFGEYRPAVGGESHLLRVLDEAERRAVMMNDAFAREHGREPDATERFGWDGPAMPLIRQAMSKRGSVERLAFFTASNHLPWEWDGFFKKLRALKRIRHAHGMDRHGGRTVPHVFSVKDPESIFFGRAGMVEIKGNITRALSQNIAGLSVGKHFELSPDPREAARGLQREGHTLIVADDDPVMLAELRKRLAELSGEYNIGQTIKFVLVNTSVSAGDFDELWPHRYTVFHRRVPRAATPAEIAKWTGCEDLLN